MTHKVGPGSWFIWDKDQDTFVASGFSNVTHARLYIEAQHLTPENLIIGSDDVKEAWEYEGGDWFRSE